MMNPIEIEKWWAQIQKYRKSGLEKVKIIPEYEKELIPQISDAAYFLSIKNLSYNQLCWLLAEKQLIVQTGNYDVIKDGIHKKAEEIFSFSYTYEKLCWLIAELDTLIEKGRFKIK